MAASEAVSPLLLALVAGGFTTFGVVIKIGYDAIAARRATKAAGLERFADERRQVYVKFYDLMKQQLQRDRALYSLVQATHKGKTAISDEEKATVGPSLFGELATTLDDMRRLARIYSVITCAEAILRLFLDMTRAAGVALDNPGPNDEITWFVLNNFIEDRIAEFVHGYREDLGLGVPKGAPKTWPVDQKVQFPMNWTRDQAEAIMRAHIPRR
jgi:hypothetical protein